MIRNNAKLISGACLALALCLAAGFWLDSSSFAGNVLAELAGVVVGVGVAVLVVERLVDQDRRARWRLVETQTIRTLRFALVKGALPLYLQLPAPRTPEADPFAMEEADMLGEALQNLAAALREREDTGPERDLLRSLLDSVGPHLDFVRDVIMQRLLTVGPDPELIKRLAVLDSTYENLDFDAWLEERFGSRADQNTQRMAELADSMGEVITYIDSH